MVFQDFLDFLVFLETSEVAGPGPNPREIDISFGAQWPLACARPDPTIGWTDVLPCVFVCVGRRYPPAAALLVRRLVVPVLNKLLQLPLHPLAGAWRVLVQPRAGMQAASAVASLESTEQARRTRILCCACLARSPFIFLHRNWRTWSRLLLPRPRRSSPRA